VIANTVGGGGAGPAGMPAPCLAAPADRLRSSPDSAAHHGADVVAVEGRIDV